MIKVIRPFFLALTIFSFSLLKGSDPEITRDRNFVGGALYGYINGGSDLYLEYGFKELRVADVTHNGKNYSVEIYEMGSPEEAFGIYSLHTFSFFKSDTLFFADCYSKYQMQCVSGKYYLSIVYDNPCDTADANAVELARLLIPGGDCAEPVIPEAIADEINVISGNLKMVTGPISSMNLPRKLSSLVAGVKNYNLWVAETTNKGVGVALFTSDNEVFFNTVRERISPFTVISQTSDSIFFSFK